MTDTARELALVTGASSGIGLELARELAQRDFDVVVCAEDNRIHAAADQLRGKGTEVIAVQADLATHDGVQQCWATVRGTGRPLEVAALNAGIGEGGLFAGETSLEQELHLVDLNCRGTVHLAKLVLEDMTARHRGRVLFTSSIAAGIPAALQAVYGASKSFVQSFALALRNELDDSGVSVTALQPGPTETEFFDRAHMGDTRVGRAKKDDPATVARQGVEALLAGKERLVAGSPMSKLQGRTSRLLPDSVKAEMHHKLAERVEEST